MRTQKALQTFNDSRNSFLVASSQLSQGSQSFESCNLGQILRNSRIWIERMKKGLWRLWCWFEARAEKVQI